MGGLTSQVALALSLGDQIRVRTYIGQPLRAEVPIVIATKSELDSLQVSLAPSREYAGLGLEYLALLNELRFKLERTGDGGNYIAISTQGVVHDPAIPLLLEVQWSGGHLLREYAIALDPPSIVVLDKRPSPTAAAKSGASTSAARDTPEVTRKRNEQPAASQGSAQNQGDRPPHRDGRYGPIRVDETLSEIAMRVRPDPKLSLPQVIIGLYDTNPDAFADGDINRLKEGESLTLPSVAQYRALSRAEAAQELDALIEHRASPAPGKKSFKVELRTPTQPATTEPTARGVFPDGTPQDADVLVGSPNAREGIRQKIDSTNAEINQLRLQNEDLQKKIEAMQQQSQNLLQQLAARGIVIANAPPPPRDQERPLASRTPAPGIGVAAPTPSTPPANNNTAAGKPRILIGKSDEGPDGTLIVVLAVIVTLAAGLAQLLTETNRQKIIEWLRHLFNKGGGTSL